MHAPINKLGACQSFFPRWYKYHVLLPTCFTAIHKGDFPITADSCPVSFDATLQRGHLRALLLQERHDFLSMSPSKRLHRITTALIHVASRRGLIYPAVRPRQMYT